MNVLIVEENFLFNTVLRTLALHLGRAKNMVLVS